MILKKVCKYECSLCHNFYNANLIKITRHINHVDVLLNNKNASNDALHIFIYFLL